MVTTKYLVKGMTCQHCVKAVSTEVGGLPGVSAVTVDLESGEVQTTSAWPLDSKDVRAAVDEAGYELVTP